MFGETQIGFPQNKCFEGKEEHEIKSEFAI